MRISTIIPAYNRADLIGDTLRSILTQTRVPDEVIVVDDGSTDGTCDAVAAFGRAVTLLRQDNAGAGPARNAGFARARGEIIHFMDSDDIASRNAYAVAEAAIAAGADMTYGPWLKTRFDGARLDPEPVVFQQGPVPPGRPLDLLALLVDWVVVFQPCFFRRGLLERAGPYRADLKPSEDSELLYRILRLAEAPVHTPESLVLYRVHPENQVSETHLDRRMIDQANFWLVLDRHLRERPELGRAVRARFRRKKYDVARDVAAYDAEKAEELARDVPVPERLVAPLRRLSRRVAAKARVIVTGHPNAPAFAAGPLTPAQRALIAELGYSLPSSSAA
jgi:glycosyltransferase involved in cell wall biosynthesis